MYLYLLFSKQKGEEAEKANNLFYHLTYYGPEDLTNIEDEEERTEIALHLAHFGHCPSQLFFQPHPSRHVDSVVTQSKVRSSNSRYFTIISIPVPISHFHLFLTG